MLIHKYVQCTLYIVYKYINTYTIIYLYNMYVIYFHSILVVVYPTVHYSPYSKHNSTNT